MRYLLASAAAMAAALVLVPAGAASAAVTRTVSPGIGMPALSIATTRKTAK